MSLNIARTNLANRIMGWMYDDEEEKPDTGVTPPLRTIKPIPPVRGGWPDNPTIKPPVKKKKFKKQDFAV